MTAVCSQAATAATTVITDKIGLRKIYRRLCRLQMGLIICYNIKNKER